MAASNHARTWLALAAMSVPVTALMVWATLPAALFFGPMLTAIAFALGGTDLKVPRKSFMFTQAILGCLIGRTLTGSILVTILNDWPAMLLVVGATIVAGAVVGWVLFRFSALPGATAALGSSPGGAAALIAVAEEFGADAQLVAFMAYLRVIIVVLSAALVSRLFFDAAPAQVAATSLPAASSFALLPLAATLGVALLGALIGGLLRLPGGAFLMPMVVAAIAQSTGTITITLPVWLLAVTYGALGWYVGLGFTRRVVLHALRAVPQLVLATLALMALCAVSAWLLTVLVHTDGLTAYLATSPGGLDSMAIIAVASHADIPLVMAIQTLRLFIVVFTGPQIAKLICRYAKPQSDGRRG